MRRALLGSFLLCAFATPVFAQRFEVPAAPGSRWFKGNTHSHTLESDGDSPPEVVAKWYRDHGYNFLVLSDHNVFVDPRRLAGLMTPAFILIPGEELTNAVGAARTPVHVNGLNIPGYIAPQTDSTVLRTLQRNVDAVRAVNGVPHINHPNFGWAIDAQTLAQVRNDKLLEIFNGHPLVHNTGTADSPGMERVWDILLSGGKRIYGIAVDDAHHFQGEFARERSNPGRGWVVVRANSLEPGEIMRRLEAGEFYASTGVELEAVTVTTSRIEVRIKQNGSFRYTTEFIGTDGRVLGRTTANPAVFNLRSERGYVRARVTDSGGAVAWLQPVFITR